MGVWLSPVSSITVPWGWWSAAHYDNVTHVLKDMSGNVRDSLKTIGVKVGSGSSSNNNFPFIYGNATSSYVVFPTGSIPVVFTICSLTRWMGNENQQRVLQGSSLNFAHGHHHLARGAAIYNFVSTSNNGWLTPHSYPNGVETATSYGVRTDWLVMCGKNAGHFIPFNVLVDDQPVGDAFGGPMPHADRLRINCGTLQTCGESSDWALSQVIVWEEALSDIDMGIVSAYLTGYLRTGNINYQPTPPIQSQVWLIVGLVLGFVVAASMYFACCFRPLRFTNNQQQRQQQQRFYLFNTFIPVATPPPSQQGQMMWSHHENGGGMIHSPFHHQLTHPSYPYVIHPLLPGNSVWYDTVQSPVHVQQQQPQQQQQQHQQQKQQQQQQRQQQQQQQPQQQPTTASDHTARAASSDLRSPPDRASITPATLLTTGADTQRTSVKDVSEAAGSISPAVSITVPVLDPGLDHYSPPALLLSTAAETRSALVMDLPEAAGSNTAAVAITIPVPDPGLDHRSPRALLLTTAADAQRAQDMGSPEAARSNTAAVAVTVPVLDPGLDHHSALTLR